MDVPIQVFGSGWVTSDSLWFWTPINVFGSGRVPHVRPNVHGPKTDFSNAFTLSAKILALGGILFAHLPVAF
jgi:hypothetical protein